MQKSRNAKWVDAGGSHIDVMLHTKVVKIKHLKKAAPNFWERRNKELYFCNVTQPYSCHALEKGHTGKYGSFG